MINASYVGMPAEIASSMPVISCVVETGGMSAGLTVEGLKAREQILRFDTYMWY